ncbi:MAG: HIT family protein [candidate division NC10 bacterium]|nr:HIT family protein [candidate division NC10 bacterium]
MDCVFCKIRDGEVPAMKLHEDARTLAFMDINPLNEGHLLVMIRAHAPTLLDASEEDLAAVIRTVRRMAAAVQTVLNPDGINLLQANGEAAFQSVRHFHMHVVPRWKGDGKGLTWTLVRGDLEKIRATAEKIRAAL